MTAKYEQSHAFGVVIDVLEAIGATYAIWGGIAVVANSVFVTNTQDTDEEQHRAVV